jgi:hypothetical protein
MEDAMTRICYVPRKFRSDQQLIIDQANEIIAEFQNDGHELTLRQLYYQFVAKAFIENNEKSYKRIGDIINNGRLAGQIDWEAIIDRTRNLDGRAHWRSPGDMIESAAYGYAIDLCADQPYYTELWVEKDAAAGVADRIARELDINWFSCRGYTSSSEMWEAGKRLAKESMRNRIPVIIHVGDHDPSGKDMTNDIGNRLRMFMGGRHGEKLIVNRIALNWDQIQEYQPPPNFAKVSDPRAAAYIAEFGDDSWELDALSPNVLMDLVREAVLSYRDMDRYNRRLRDQHHGQDLLMKASRRWDELAEYIDTLEDAEDESEE